MARLLVGPRKRSGKSRETLLEVVATFGLICVILGTVKTRPAAASDTFAGIYLNDAPGFLVGQAIGAALALVFMKWLLAPSPNETRRG